MNWNHMFALAGGVLLAGVGGELFVRGLVGIARWLRVSPGIIGATVAAFATSSPELSVAISSGAGGHPRISLGDALGSNVVNVALILALALIISPVPCRRESIRRDFRFALVIPAITGLLMLDGGIGRIDAVIMLALFSAWFAAAVQEARRHRDATGEVLGRRPALLAALSGIAGLLCLFAGGRLIVIGAEGVARALGVPEFMIGAVVVAVGTSVPELATVIISQLRGHKEVSLGIILGSNIFNGLFIVPVAALICPISTAGRGVVVSLIVGTIAVALTYPSRSGCIGRNRGAMLLGVYVIYVVMMVLA